MIATVIKVLNAFRSNFGTRALLSTLTGFVLPTLAIAGNGEPTVQEDSTRKQCVILEMFIDSSRDFDQQLEDRVKRFARERGGTLLAIRDLNSGEASKKRLAQITSHFKIQAREKPLLYCLNQVIYDKASLDEYQKTLAQAMQIEVFVRSGCSRCAAVEKFLTSYATRYPALTVIYRDITSDRRSLESLNQLVAKHRKAASSVPVIHICDYLLIGFASEQIIRNRLDDLLRRWTRECPEVRKADIDSDSQSCAEVPRLELLVPQLVLNPIDNRVVAVSGVAAAHPFQPRWSR